MRKLSTQNVTVAPRAGMRGKQKTKAQLVKEIEALHRINQAISGTLDSHETLQRIVNETVDLLAAQSGSVILFHLAEGEAEVSTSYGHDRTLQTLRYPLAGSLVGWVVEHEQPLQVFQLTPQEWPTSWKLGEQLGAAPDDVSVLLAPLWVEKTLVGSLEVVWKPQHRTTEQEVRLLEAIAVQAAMAITHTRLYQENEQALRRVQANEERFRAAAEGGLDALFLLESVRDETGKIADFRFVDLNSRGKQMLAPSGEKIIGQHLCERWPVTRTEGLFDKYVQVVETGAVLEEEISFFEPGIAARWLQLQVVPLADGVAVTSRDITERKQAEEERQLLQRQLLQAQKMEAIGTLAGGIAHDFNNILSMILGFTELVTDEVSKESRACKNLDEVIKAGRRAKDLVQQLLTFSRSGAQERHVVDVAHVVEETLSFLRASLLPTTTLTVDVDSIACLAFADPTQIQQVVMNLCINAARAMEQQRGRLEISLQRVQIPQRLVGAMFTLDPGAYLKLMVCDSGCGMPPEVVSRIFEPFFTTKPMGEGGGLGLAVVHGIVTDHNGAIGVESQPGEGSTFSVYLPAYEGEQEQYAVRQ